METLNTQAVLKDLVQIANDRITAFEKAEERIWESYPDVKSDYDRMITQSKVMKNELINSLRENENVEEDSATLEGNLYQIWLDIKNTFQINPVNATLNSIVAGEEAALEAYEEALQEHNISSSLRKILEDHLYKLRTSYEQFRQTLDYKKEE